jgi:mRNA interferase RelE/StbE
VKAVRYLPAAAKALRKHRADAERLMAKIDSYADDPAPLANLVKRLQGSTALRLRVGDYRIIFEETADEIVVTKIAPRGSAYE